jgi:Outer membrane lipoprotein
MKDPRRLVAQRGTLESQLLEAVRDVDPPADARDEVWQRLASGSSTFDSSTKKLGPVAAWWGARVSSRRRERAVAAGAGAATWVAAAPLAARTALGAGTRAFAQAGWLSVVKWVAVVGTVAPAAGMSVHWAVTSRNTASPSPLHAPAPRPVPPAEALPPAMQETPKMVQAAVEAIPSSSVPALRRGGSSPLSNLDAESALLRRAREKLENGDSKGALDDVALLAARFPHGELAQEREVVAIHSLLLQGQRVAAAARTADFLRVHPNSPYADSLRQALKP